MLPQTAKNYNARLKKDSQSFKKTNVFSSVRDISYWIVIIKTNILSRSFKKSNKKWRLFLVPLAFLIYGIIAEDDFFIALSVFGGFFLLVFILIFGLSSSQLIGVGNFDMLAKFLIKNKGEFVQNKIKMRLSTEKLIDKQNQIDIADLGLSKTNKTKYKAYKKERIKGEGLLHNGLYMKWNLIQLVLKVTTTKRRSSGKVKSKTKWKHKMFYSLQLHGKTDKFALGSTEGFQKKYPTLILQTKTENGYHFVQLKYKDKPMKVLEKMDKRKQDQSSTYNIMLEAIAAQKLLIPTSN
ncbi:MAG: hypothetical protein OIF50_06395 [Flavobacteriaceae bacterium]|nr:hypothetical protein [Flavobacteriaceae bacterium]